MNQRACLARKPWVPTAWSATASPCRGASPAAAPCSWEPGNCITYSLVIPTALVEGMSFEQAYHYLDQWVMEVLEKLGIKAKYVPLNDIASEFGKIGGAARWANGYMVHHVTMAYDIDAFKMNEVLRIGMEKIRDKGTRSAVKRVDPMRSQTGMAREEWVHRIP